MEFSRQEYCSGWSCPPPGHLPDLGIKSVSLGSPELTGGTFTLDHLTCLLRNLYAGQEATVRTGHRTTDWFQIGKGVRQGCILSPCLFKLYAEYLMRNAGLDEAQAGIKIASRSIKNLRYADDTTLMAESEEELKNLLMEVKGESKNVAQNSTFRKRRSWHLVPSLHGK